MVFHFVFGLNIKKAIFSLVNKDNGELLFNGDGEPWLNPCEEDCKWNNNGNEKWDPEKCVPKGKHFTKSYDFQT